MNGLYYSKRNEWVRFADQSVLIGITGRGLKGDVVYIELPEIGQHIKQGEPCATVESVKADIEVASPVEGVVSAVNDTVYDDPDMIARDPMSVWLVKLDCGAEPDTEELLTEAEYTGL